MTRNVRSGEHSIHMSDSLTDGGTGTESPGTVPRAESTDEAADHVLPEVRGLIEKGKERGFVTYDELNKVLPDDLVSPEKLDQILQKMEDLGIEVVEAVTEDEEGKAAGYEPDDGEREPEEPKEKGPKIPGSTAKIDDPVRLYLM